MSTHMPGFQSFSAFLHHFVLTKLATISILTVKHWYHYDRTRVRAPETTCVRGLVGLLLDGLVERRPPESLSFLVFPLWL